MMYGPIRAIAIDDRPTHLIAIGSGLAAVGIPCMSYWYDRNSLKLVPDAKPHDFLRLVFMDLNLAELGGNPDPKNLVGVVMDVLKQVISSEAGPYLLVFWTEVAGKIPEVRELLYQRLNGIPAPLDVVELSKRRFLPNYKADAADLDSNLIILLSGLAEVLAGLAKEVDKLASARPELNVVSAWESRATEAAARSVNEVVRHARADVQEPTEVGASLRRVLSTICRAAVGQTRSEAEPARSLDAGMVEILADQFSVSVETPDYVQIVSDALLDDIKRKVVFANNTKIAPALNAFFQVDTHVSSAKTTDRGVVIPGAALFTEQLLGGTHIDLLREDFMLSPKDTPETKKAVAELEKSAELLLVEVGAECDHAQAKPRTLRYLVGFQIPQVHLSLVRSKDGKLRQDALQLLGPWDMEGGVLLLVSCRRFFTWQDSKPPAGKVKYRLRNSVVSKLLHHYSALSSRPGIVEFRI